jgi:hypothetical protein
MLVAKIYSKNHYKLKEGCVSCVRWVSSLKFNLVTKKEAPLSCDDCLGRFTYILMGILICG